MNEEMNKEIPLGHEGYILSFDADCPHCGYEIACGEPEEPTYDIDCTSCYERMMHREILSAYREAFEGWSPEDDSF